MRSPYLILLCLSVYGPCVSGSSLCAADDLDNAVFLQSVVSTSLTRAEDENITTDEKDEKAWFAKAHQFLQQYFAPCASLAAWLTYTIVAAGYAWGSKPQGHSDKLERVREHHWDVAKAWFMMLVVCNHIPKQGDIGQLKTLSAQMFTRFEMCGFSFVSGLMAASLVDQPASSKTSILENDKLLRRFRDLVLANFTCVPLTVMLCVLLRSCALLSISPLTSAVAHGSVAYGAVSYRIFDLPLLKIPSTWTYWFLPTLFLWYLLAPTFRLLRFPFTLSLMTSMVVGSNDAVATKALGLFPFFVAGFLLGGGCLPAEERTECREKLAKYAKSNIARGIAAALLVAWFAVLTNFLPHLPACITYPGFNAGVPSLQWAQGGAFATLISICISMLGVGVHIVMCFAIPDSVATVVGRVGSRTLYIYLLHVVAIADLHYNEKGKMVIAWQPQSAYMRLILVGMEAMWIAALFGSDLTVDLTHHFVQPQWLLNFITSSQPVQNAQGSTGVPEIISES